jgi:hypothetical protein
VTLLLPPDYDTKPILDMLWQAWHLRWGKDEKKWPVGSRVNPLRMPEDVIRDAGEKTKFAGYLPGWKFISARSDYMPVVRDRTQPRQMEDGQLRFPILPVERKDECYAGRWAYISANAYSYANKTTGVSLGLDGILLGRNDARLSGGGSRSNKSFDDIAEELVEDPMS